jgi:hypothetical protein
MVINILFGISFFIVYGMVPYENLNLESMRICLNAKIKR